MDTTTPGQRQQRHSLSTVVYKIRKKSAEVWSALRPGQRSGRAGATDAEGGDEVHRNSFRVGVRGTSDAAAALGVGGASPGAPVLMPSSLPDDPEAEQHDPEAEQSSVSPGAGGVAVK